MFCVFELLNSYLLLGHPLLTRLQLHGCFASVSCHCSQLATAFIARLFLGPESGGIGTSFDSCGAADSLAVLSISSLLRTFLSTSFAGASFNTSLLRSTRSAPYGVVLIHSSMLARQGSEWACARFPDLIALQPGHLAVVPTSVQVILSLCTRAPSNGTGGGGGNGSICVTGLATVHLPSAILHGTPITLLIASLSPQSCCSILRSRALRIDLLPSPRSTRHLFLTPSHTPNLYLGFILFNSS